MADDTAVFRLLVTVITPVVATTGTSTVRLEADCATKLVMSVPVPKRTPVTASRPAPVMVTGVPGSPLAGAKLLMAGQVPGAAASTTAFEAAEVSPFRLAVAV